MIESYTANADGTPNPAGTCQALYVDRPLEVALADSDKCFPGPAGALNMAFHRNAIALVTRPLAIPNNAMGVLAHVGVYNDIAMRVSMQYSIAERRHGGQPGHPRGRGHPGHQPLRRSPGLSLAVSRHESAWPGAIRAGRPFSLSQAEALAWTYPIFGCCSGSMGRWFSWWSFFLWQNWLRELRMSNRITKLEDEQRKVLLPMVERCTDVITQNTAMMERLEKALDGRVECPLRRTCPQG